MQLNQTKSKKLCTKNKSTTLKADGSPAPGIQDQKVAPQQPYFFNNKHKYCVIDWYLSHSAVYLKQENTPRNNRKHQITRSSKHFRK